MADDAPLKPESKIDPYAEGERLGQAASDSVQKFSEDSKIDPAFEERLKAVETKGIEHKRKRETLKAQESKRNRVDAASTKGLGVGMTVAYAILGMPLFGAAVGWFIDQRLGISMWQGILMLVGAVAGIAFTVFTLQKSDTK